MNRLYVVESTPSNTGAMADHRLPVRSSDIEGICSGSRRPTGCGFRPIASDAPPRVPVGWLDALARDLHRHHGTSLIVAGASQPPFVHALAHALNDLLGNTNQTVVYTAPVEAEALSLRELAEDMEGGLVDVLLVLGGNPVYTAPVDLRLADAWSGFLFAFTWARMKMKRPRCVTGIFPKRTIWNRGAIFDLLTAPCRSCNR